MRLYECALAGAGHAIVKKALHEITLPMHEKSGCRFEIHMILPKLLFINGDTEGARKTFETALLEVDKSDSMYRRRVDKSVLLETADMVAPDQVYAVYHDISDDPFRWITLESFCANPWVFPNLLNTPRFRDNVRRDGRFVKFLEHYKFL